MRFDSIALAVAAILFVVYFSNVALGAADMSVMFSDLYEMLVLFAAAICFTAGILGREANEPPQRSDASD